MGDSADCHRMHFLFPGYYRSGGGFIWTDCSSDGGNVCVGDRIWGVLCGDFICRTCGNHNGTCTYYCIPFFRNDSDGSWVDLFCSRYSVYDDYRISLRLCNTGNVQRNCMDMRKNF